MKLLLDPRSIESYRTFLRVKELPSYRIVGRMAIFPDEYAGRIGVAQKKSKPAKYRPHPRLFDYQRDIARLAIEKQKFAVFADCGLGKTLIMLEFVKHAAAALPADRKCLIVSPLMVIEQTIGECQRFYGDTLKLERVKSSDLNEWLSGSNGGIGITNYEVMRENVVSGKLGCLALDESSMLKSHYGKYGQECLRLGEGLEWKMALTGTPAPNDRIEFANHAVFLDHFPNVNSFLARFFVNRGQTQERWELKPHALRPFYRALSHWCIFLTDPSVYGWRDNCEALPPMHVHIHDVDLTDAQQNLVRGETGTLFASRIGGIGSRSTLARIAKGRHRGESVATNKFSAIVRMVESWPDESTIIWCHYNDEQDTLAAMLPDAANISGDTPHERRMELIADFKAGRRKVLISKPRILGFGLNLQVATRQVFSTLQDSYEEYYQAVKRSNRYGSTKPLHIHIPLTDIEEPMVATVLRKSKRVYQDSQEQEKLFREITAQERRTRPC